MGARGRWGPMERRVASSVKQMKWHSALSADCRSHREKSAMKTITFLVGACALLAFPVEAAVAGPCTVEIENLTKLLASRDAGAGATAGATTSTGQHPPTAAMGAADKGTAASSAAAESERGHARPQHLIAGGQDRPRATPSGRSDEPGNAGRGRFAAGCAEPNPRWAYGHAAGGRCSPARF
jgi:hypothetical protein